MDRAGSSVLEFLLSWSPNERPNLDWNMAETVAVTCWFIWWDRRQLVFEQKSQNPGCSANSIRALLSAFSTASHPQAQLKRGGWTKPPPGMVKINVDASFDADSLSGSMGAVIRDDAGLFIVGANKRIPWCADAHVAEAEALRMGLDLACSVGCHRIMVNSDYQDVMNDGGRSSTLAAAIVEDCYQLSTDFVKIVFEHCPREANCVAHELAKLAKFSPPSVWWDVPPSCVFSLLAADVSPISIK